MTNKPKGKKTVQSGFYFAIFMLPVAWSFLIIGSIVMGAIGLTSVQTMQEMVCLFTFSECV